MAQTLEAMRRRIESAEDLYSVVRVMKALAAANIRQCEQTVESLLEYSRTVREGFQIALRHSPGPIADDEPADSRWGVVVFGSDQGMCGSFNEQITQYAQEQLQELSTDKQNFSVLVVGVRIFGRLEDAGYPIAGQFSLPSTVTSITSSVNEVLLQIEELRLQAGISRFLLVHHRPLPPASYFPAKKQFLPLNRDWLEDLSRRPWKSRSLPTFTMDWPRLFASLVRQHLFVTLYRAFAESMASENSSRLASMQAAEKNIEEHLSTLTMEYHQGRQQTITEELLDIVAGFETLTKEEARRRKKK